MERGGGKVERLERLNEMELKNFAADLASVLEGGVVLLIGELGAGKTTFVRGMAAGIGIDEKIVRSPTFVLMNVYQGERVIYHVDLYRLADPEEIFYIGLDEVIGDEEAIVAVEWADLFPQLWEDIDRIEITIKVRSEKERDLEIRCFGEEGVVSEAIRRWKEKRTR